MKRITEIASKLGVKELELYGDNKAKIKYKPSNRKAKLILVTATNPTKYGEGKTT
ncbi:MAG: formate--tetrahydrofolate ligase, partial [Romboutsia sp.]|nr:formate--tetrahydrofolate ligase [Romboutsia sp.]